MFDEKGGISERWRGNVKNIETRVYVFVKNCLPCIYTRQICHRNHEKSILRHTLLGSVQNRQNNRSWVGETTQQAHEVRTKRYSGFWMDY